MKHIVHCLICAGLTGVLAACATWDGPETLNDDTSLVGDIALTVYGLSCPLCASNVDQHLNRLPGVIEVYPDLETGAVRITLEEGQALPVSAFAKAVRDAGFTMQSARMVEETP